MTSLSNNWFCDGNADFEYKRYVLLGYLQYVNRHFKDTMLYPSLAELVQHYRNLSGFLHSKKRLDDGFPKEMVGIDVKKLRIIYKKVLQENNILETIETLVQFSLPKIKAYLNNGKEIYDFIEDNLNLYSVGLVPIRKDEGYIILASHKKEYLVYNYVMSIFSNANDKYRSLQTTYIKSYAKSLVNTLPNIKTDLIKTYSYLPNPATYVVETEINIPIRETFLPIAKKMLVAHLMETNP